MNCNHQCEHITEEMCKASKCKAAPVACEIPETKQRLGESKIAAMVRNGK